MSQSSMSAVEAFINDTAPVNNEGQVICHHQTPARRSTSRSLTNPGRDFYTCSKNSSDPNKCRFFKWADDPTLCSVLETRQSSRKSPTMPPVTPQRPSQAMRALFSRSPTIASASLRKRQRTSSPTPGSSFATASEGAVKHRRVDSAVDGGARLGAPTPSRMASQRSEGSAGGEKGTQDAKKAALLRSIQDAILATPAAPRDPSPSSSTSGFPRHDNLAGSSRASRNQSDSDVLPQSTPSSLPRNIQNPQTFPRHAPGSQSSSGTSVYSEIEVAEEMQELEPKAVQTSPVDDGSSIEEDVWTTPSPLSAVGSPAPAPNVGPGPGRMYQDHLPGLPQGSGAEGAAWSPAPPQTPGLGGSSRVFSPGGNEGTRNTSMLLTPPGTSQRHQISEAGARPLSSQRGRTLVQEMLASPASSGRSGPVPFASPTGHGWQSLQDDPENPFRAATAEHRAVSPAPTAISMADSVGGASVDAGALSADSIASHIAALQSIPEYVAKLERREKAARKSAEVKGKKIAQLEEEVQRLRNEKRALEETVAALQTRR